jgi:hypothetical protein
MMRIFFFSNLDLEREEKKKKGGFKGDNGHT